MFDLFFNEFRRYRLVAIVLGILFVALLATFSGMKPIMANDIEVLGFQGLAMLIGFALGCCQITLHKRKSNWAYLVHRPLTLSRIFIAIFGAGFANLIIAIAIPFLLLFIGLDLLNVDLVELRHYLFTLHVFMLCIFTYLVGSYIVLSPNKSVFVTGFLLFYMMSSDPNSAQLTLLVDLLGILALLGLNISAFKANLNEHHKSIPSKLLAITTLHMGIIALLMLGQMVFYHLPMMIVDKHPDNYSKQQLHGYFAILWQLEPQELIDYMVKEETYPDKAILKQQIKHASSAHIKFNYEAPLANGQLFHQDEVFYGLADKKRHHLWIYSHQHQVFVGKSTKNNDLVGYLTRSSFLPATADLSTLEKDDKFATPPRLYAGKFIQEYDRTFIVDFEGQYIEVKHQLSEQEYYTHSIQQPRDSQMIILLSNKAIYAFNTKPFYQDVNETQPNMVVEHYREFAPMNFITVFDLVDGYLLDYYSNHYFGFDRPGAALVYAKHSGERILVAETTFKNYRPLPDWTSHQAFWMSPIIYSIFFEVFEDTFKHNHDPGKQTFESVLNRERPDNIYWLALVSVLLTLVLTITLATRFNMPKKDIAFWGVIVIVYGLPGFCCFLLMNHWREHLAASSRRRQSHVQKTVLTKAYLG